MTYLEPYGFLRFVIWGAWIWACSPYQKLNSISKRPLAHRISVWILILSMFGLFFWQSHLLNRKELDWPTTAFFMAMALAWALHFWSKVTEASEDEVKEIFGYCIGTSYFLRHQEGDR
ncbi:hypothetical protein FEM03_10845 [Phragmitibacter flavus]|uniref:Uncharacterized protein n=1 Tax=Phragmitibacter flavus TaxID=2576071 RepID=A0A5R8KES2_9BACT|nr:hypothetical protein FEM03_10845 [Phragmitibacter flavus]